MTQGILAVKGTSGDASLATICVKKREKEGKKKVVRSKYEETKFQTVIQGQG